MHFTLYFLVFLCKTHLIDVEAQPITSLVIEKLFTVVSVYLSWDKDKVFYIQLVQLRVYNYID